MSGLILVLTSSSATPNRVASVDSLCSALKLRGGLAADLAQARAVTGRTVSFKALLAIDSHNLPSFDPFDRIKKAWNQRLQVDEPVASSDENDHSYLEVS